MKLYAMQIPVEHQESPFEIYGKDDLYEDTIITGNSRMNEYTTKEYDMLMSNYEWLWDEYHAEEQYKEYENFVDALNSIMPKTNGNLYSDDEIYTWEFILSKNDDIYNMEKYFIADLLMLITDTDYLYAQISGCVQREWQGVFYPIGQVDIEKLEADYFNTGTEWRIIESDEDYEDEDELPTEDANYVYCYGYNDDMIKQELSEDSGISVEDIVLFKYEGYIQMPKYSRV